MLQNNDISIKIDNLTLQKKIDIVKDLSLNLHKNNIVSLIGGSEQFNEIICEIILGYLRVELEIISGDIILNIDEKLKNILEFKKKELQDFRRKRVGIVYKKSSFIFVDVEKIGKQMIDILLVKSNKTIKEIKDEIKKLMIFFDIPLKVFNKYPQHIKESRKNILAFIIIIIMKPNFLILNEPFNSDIITRNKMIALIKRYKNDMAILILTSDILILSLENFVDEAIIIEENSALLNGSPRSILSSNLSYIKQMIKEASFIF